MRAARIDSDHAQRHSARLTFVRNVMSRASCMPCSFDLRAAAAANEYLDMHMDRTRWSTVRFHRGRPGLHLGATPYRERWAANGWPLAASILKRLGFSEDMLDACAPAFESTRWRMLSITRPQRVARQYRHVGIWFVFTVAADGHDLTVRPSTLRYG